MNYMLGIVLLLSILSMFFILLQKEETLKVEKTRDSVHELSETLRESIMFAMAGGVTDISPFILQMKKNQNIRELRVIPTNLIRPDSELKFDTKEKEVLSTRKPEFTNEVFKGEDVVSSIELLPSNETCTSCHVSQTGDPLAVVSIRYTMASTNATIASQRLEALIMGIAVLLFVFFVVRHFLNKYILKDLQRTGSAIDALSLGIITEDISTDRNDEIGNLLRSLQKLQIGLRHEAEVALKISEGDLSSKIDLLSKDDILGKAIQTVQGNLIELVNTTDMLCSAAIEGNLAKRIEVDKQKGDYQKIFIGINNILESVINPVKEGAVALAQMAQGDFTCKITGNYKGDHKLIIDSINTLNDSLSGLISDIHNAAEATASAGAEISSSAERMAAGAQIQSAQTNDVASAVEEMTKTIVETTRNTSIASDTAKNAGAMAQRGVTIVSQTIEGMNGIADVVTKSADTVFALGQNSDKIGEIAQVIDDIADQTNLLALNAAIEAARAGEQGRGFAVVADEVRKLAERTTKATKEIALMIKQIQNDTFLAVESIREGKRKVEVGKKLAGEAGESLLGIVQGTQKVTDIIVQVAATSEQQSATAEEISKNIEGINNVTSESAGGIEQMAKSAEDLNRLTDNLRNLLGKFRIERHFTARSKITA